MVEAFVSKTRQLLELERNAEIDQAKQEMHSASEDVQNVYFHVIRELHVFAF